MKIKKEHKTALIVITALALFVWGFNFLKGKDIFKSYDTYYSVLDNVEGVVSSTPVTLKGIQIGTIKEMKFVNGFDKTMLVLDIDRHFRFPKDSKVKIYGGNIMGGKNVAIIPGHDTQMAQDGDTLRVLKMPGMFDLVNDKITPLQNKLDRILSSTDTLLIGLNNILNPEMQNHLKQGIEDFSGSMHQVVKTTKTFNQFLDKHQQNLDHSVENVNKITENLAHISDTLNTLQIGRLVNNFNQTINKLNQSLDKLNKGKGSMAQLLNDPKLYQNLEQSTRALNLLLEDLRAHPKRYVHFSIWGKKEKTQKK